jgi:methylenetetrahydrofolate dehydrogenase (NADP+)/methenyltetrahydrofolate cyclohydrolase
MPEICRGADILVVSAGRAGVIDKNYLSPGQTILDVGINVGEDGSLRGDVNFADADGIVSAVTPTPGGIGAVTSSVLMEHVLTAAEGFLVISPA